MGREYIFLPDQKSIVESTLQFHAISPMPTAFYSTFPTPRGGVVEWRRATAIAKSAVAASAAAATARKEQNETNTAVPQKGFRACESAVS
jgi:hypothetical protein